jgi:hypothetical protein
MVWLIGHRQPKGAATAMPDLPSPRHTSTPPAAVFRERALSGGPATNFRFIDQELCVDAPLESRAHSYRRLNGQQLAWLTR